MLIVVFSVFAYLFGSIPFGLLISKAKGVNLKTIGSGNIGATNVARACGKPLALLTFVLDGLKGLIPMLIAKHFINDWICIVGLFAILGHIFSIFLKFKGGKGVSTTFISFFAISPAIAVAILLSWISTFILTKYSSLSAIVAITMGLIISILSQNIEIITFASGAFILIIYKHVPNIKRLMLKKESKF